MSEANCAVVAYLPGELGDLVDAIRKALNPSYAAWRAHVTILPPRPLPKDPERTADEIQQRCAPLEPFGVAIDGVSTFWPLNGVVYLSLSAGGDRLVELHESLNSGELAQQELYPYVPHLTIAQELKDEAGTRKALADVSERWRRYAGQRRFRVESLSLVRQTSDNLWLDLATLRLGTLLAPSRR